MGKSVEQILAEAKPGESQINVKVVTIQDNGIVGYASGALLYKSRSPFMLATSSDSELTQCFSDRVGQWPKPPAAEAGTWFYRDQPFDSKQADSLGLRVTAADPRKPSVEFTLRSWGSGKFTVGLDERRANVYIGTGPAVGRSSARAVYLVTFTGFQNQAT